MSSARIAAAAVATTWLCAAGTPASATPSDYVLEMEMSFLGMTVGRAELRAAAAPEGMAQRLSIETVGLAQRLTGYKSEVSSLARLDDGEPRSLAFDTKSESKRATREVLLRYDDDGQVVELATFKRGREERSEVPEALQNDTIDPLAAMTAIRDWLAEARATVPNATTIAVFDGRRRFDLEVALLDRREARFADGPTPILEVEVVLKPLAGFNDDDQDERRLLVLASDDDVVFPLIMRTTASSGLQASLYTRRACTGDGARSCRDYAY